MIDLEKMAKEHEKLFPKATLESQVWKLEEEINEFCYADLPEASIRELADIWIVLGGLYRWCPKTAVAMYGYYSDGEINALYGTDNIEAGVNRKWQINLKRKWEWNGKTYHHVGEEQ